MIVVLSSLSGRIDISLPTKKILPCSVKLIRSLVAFYELQNISFSSTRTRDCFFNHIPYILYIVGVVMRACDCFQVVLTESETGCRFCVLGTLKKEKGRNRNCMSACVV